MSSETVISRITNGTTVEIRDVVASRPILTNSVTDKRFDPDLVQRDAESTRIVIHDRYPQLVEAFLAHKRQHGSAIERALYNSDGWNWAKQVARLGI